MKKNNVKNFIQSLKAITMTTEEKSMIKNRLMDFAGIETTRSPYYQKVFFFAKRGVIAAFVLIFSVGSLAHSAAGKTLPGDELYPIKLAYEEIKLVVTLDSEKKVNYEITRTEKRIQEATTLAQKNKLDEKKKEVIADTIKKQTQKVQNRIQEVKNSNPEKALALNTELSTAITTNIEILKNVNKEEQETVHNPENTTINLSSVNELDIALDTSGSKIQQIDTQNSKKENGASLVISLVASIENEVSTIQEQRKAIEQEIETKKKQEKESLDPNQEGNVSASSDEQNNEEASSLLAEFELSMKEIETKITLLKEELKEKNLITEEHSEQEKKIRGEISVHIKNKEYSNALEKLKSIYEMYQKANQTVNEQAISLESSQEIKINNEGENVSTKVSNTLSLFR